MASPRSRRHLAYANLVVGTAVMIGDAPEVREALAAHAEDDAGVQDREATVRAFAGRRGVVSFRPTSNAKLLETGGRVRVKLIADFGGGEALLPPDCLYRDGVELRLRHEKEKRLEAERKQAQGDAAETIQQAWRTAMAQRGARIILALRRAEKEAAAVAAFDAPTPREDVEYARAALERERAAREHVAATRLQARARGTQGARRAAEHGRELRRRAAADAAAAEVARARAAADAAEGGAATAIQARWRAKCAQETRRSIAAAKRRARREDSDDDYDDYDEDDSLAYTATPAKAPLAASQLGEFLRKAAGLGRTGALEGILGRCAAELLHGVDEPDGDGSTPLALACGGGHADCARLLVGAGADPNRTNRGGWAPLHRACFGGHAKTVKWLLDAKRGAGASPAAVNARGSGAIHACVPGGHARLLEYLADAEKRPVDDPNVDGDTPLHFAVLSRQPGVAALLVARGADVMRKNAAGKTPSDLAAAGGDARLRRALAAGERRRPSLRNRNAADAPSKKQRRKAPRKKTVIAEAKEPLPERGSPAFWRRQDNLARDAWRSAETLRAALPPAWKLASEDVCGRLALNGEDVKTVLRALAIVDEERLGESDDAFGDGMPPLSPLAAEGVPPRIAHVDLTSVAATRTSIAAAASRFDLPLGRRLTRRRARVAQKRLLELIRGPALALKFIHDAVPGGRVNEWAPEDVAELLRMLGAAPDALPAPALAGGLSTLRAARLLVRGAAALPASRGSAVVRARVAFHLALLARLGDWRALRDDAARAAAAARDARTLLRDAKRSREWGGAANARGGDTSPPGAAPRGADTAGSGAAAAAALSRSRDAANAWADPWAAPRSATAATPAAPNAPPVRPPAPPRFGGRRESARAYADLDDVDLAVVGAHVTAANKAAAAEIHLHNVDSPPRSPRDVRDVFAAANDDEEVVCGFIGSATRETFSLGASPNTRASMLAARRLGRGFSSEAL